MASRRELPPIATGDVLLVVRKWLVISCLATSNGIYPHSSSAVQRCRQSLRFQERTDCETSHTDDFVARSTDELSLARGDRIQLIEKDDDFGDGWYLGRHLQSGTTGLFPESKLLQHRQQQERTQSNADRDSIHHQCPPTNFAAISIQITASKS